jgi:wobble nucleotide-excising tRNase
MLKKIVAIKGIGKFRDYSAKGDTEFRKLTLLYAENACGKTTLCDILRSLQSGDGAQLTARRTLGSPNSPETTIRLETQTVSFKAGKWSASFPDVAIFDTRFVHDNIFAGDYVDHEHKRNLYRLIVGEQGVTLARKVDELDERIRDITKAISAQEKAISPHLPQGMKPDVFVALPNPEDLDTQITDKQAEVNALKSASDIAAKGKLKEIHLPALPENFACLLTKTVDDVSADVERYIRDHLANRTNGANETWLSQGLDFVLDNTCPFCQQTLNASNAVSIFRSYFSESYSALKAEIIAADTTISTLFGDAALLAFQKSVAGNLTLLQFWKQFVAVDSSAITSELDLSPWPSLRDAARRCLATKKAAPLEPLALSPALGGAIDNYSCLALKVAQYNEAASAANVLIDQNKSAIKAGNLMEATSTLLNLQASKKRHDPETSALCDTYQDLLQEKKSLDRQKRDAKKELDQFTEEVFAKYQTRINDLLDLFGATFQIGNTKGQYLGGKASSTYQIIINSTPVDLGDENTPATAPSFRNTLSMGDRTTLALAFFIAQLEQDPRLANMAVVFDDPYGSQDGSRRTCTQQMICRILSAARQVIIFSHEPGFLRLVWDNVPTAEIKTLQLVCLSNSAEITEWDIKDATADEYYRQHAILKRYALDGTGDQRDIAKTIRLILEGHLRRRFPGQFLDNEWAGDMLKKIREADSTNPISAAQLDLSEMSDVNDYSKKYHHDQTNAEPINAAELKAFVKRTLKVVGGY